MNTKALRAVLAEATSSLGGGVSPWARPLLQELKPDMMPISITKVQSSLVDDSRYRQP